jgi:hypothetical protein
MEGVQGNGVRHDAEELDRAADRCVSSPFELWVYLSRHDVSLDEAVLLSNSGQIPSLDAVMAAR